MPEAATAEEIETVYLEGWKLGLKAIAIYRDGSKRSQPLSHRQEEGRRRTAEDKADDREPREAARAAQVEATKPHRRRLPVERTAVTHKFDIGGHEGYITVGLYPDGQPGEIFLKMAKEGSTVSGLMDSLRDGDQPGAAVRRAAARPREQVRPRPVRAQRLHRQQRDPDRQVDRRLHLPLARLAVPVGRRQGGARPHRSAQVVSEEAVPPFAADASSRAPTKASPPSPRRSPRPSPRRRRPRPSQLRRRPPRRSQSMTPPRPRRSLRPRQRPRQSHRPRSRTASSRSSPRTARWPTAMATATATDAAKPITLNLGGAEGRVRRPGRRPQLRRMRLDHGPQRQLLQVPQLREHQRLQLMEIA